MAVNVGDLGQRLRQTPDRFFSDLEPADRRRGFGDVLSAFGAGLMQDPSNPMAIGRGAVNAAGAARGIRDEVRERGIEERKFRTDEAESAARRRNSDALVDLYRSQGRTAELGRRRAAEELTPSQQREGTRSRTRALADELMSLVPERRSLADAYAQIGDEASAAALERQIDAVLEESGSERKYRDQRQLDREETRRDISAGVMRDPNAPPPQAPRTDFLRPADLLREVRQRQVELEESLTDQLGLNMPPEARFRAEALGQMPPLSPPAALQEQRAAKGLPPMTDQEYVEKLRQDVRSQARQMSRQSIADDLGVSVDELPGLMVQRGDPNFPDVAGDGKERGSWDSLADEQIVGGIRAKLANGDPSFSLGRARQVLSQKLTDPERIEKILYGLGLAISDGNHQIAVESGIFSVLGIGQ
jgi:hypothetical protein